MLLLLLLLLLLLCVITQTLVVIMDREPDLCVGRAARGTGQAGPTYKINSSHGPGQKITSCGGLI